jgi:hypothetical protein
MKFVKKITWFNFRIVLSSIVAMWGFYLIFKYGINSGGKSLLLIAAVAIAFSYLQLYFKIKSQKPSSTENTL